MTKDERPTVAMTINRAALADLSQGRYFSDVFRTVPEGSRKRVVTLWRLGMRRDANLAFLSIVRELRLYTWIPTVREYIDWCEDNPL